MDKPKKAVGYVCEIPILGDLVISKEFQKQRILDYARRENIELVGIYEEEHYQEDFMNRPALKEALKCWDPAVDAFLVERVWCLSRKKKELEPFLRILDQKRIQLICASYLWDCLSQQIRHRYMGALAERQRQTALALAESKYGKKAA